MTTDDNFHRQIVRPLRPGAAIDVSAAKLPPRGRGGTAGGGRGEDNFSQG